MTVAASASELLTILDIWNPCALSTEIKVDFRISLDKLTVPHSTHAQGYQRQLRTNVNSATSSLCRSVVGGWGY